MFMFKRSKSQLVNVLSTLTLMFCAQGKLHIYKIIRELIIPEKIPMIRKKNYQYTQ